VTTQGHAYHQRIEVRHGIAYGYRHNVQQKVRHGMVGRKPPHNPPCVMPCPTCCLSVLAMGTPTVYLEPDGTLHAHQRSTYGDSKKRSHHARKEPPDDVA
jgi:hypothetical protein